MRLINTFTFTQEEFFGAQDTPEYAILSHCWGNPRDEVSYQDLKNSTYRQDSYGWRKIEECCRLAQADGLQWAWVDTCCIDKSSSAELTEAINSMFEWYSAAKVCYAFLPDMESCFSVEAPFNEQEMRSLVDSRWFTRGWTLQELLAPAEVVFFDKRFQRIGTKSSLALSISKITGIDVSYLKRSRRLHTASVAARMSWASKRETTRSEDIAYCLLGIFDVNMPLLYGEGDKAFLRLQKTIIQSSQDSSLFAWDDDEETGQAIQGVLAKHPRAFRNSRDIVEDEVYLHPSEGSFEMTDRGLQYWLKSYPFGTGDVLPIRLRCKLATTGEHIMLRTVRQGRTVYRVGLERRRISRGEQLYSTVLGIVIPSHFAYIAATVSPQDEECEGLLSKKQRDTGLFRWASRYTFVSTILAVVFSVSGTSLWLLRGRNNASLFVALGALTCGLEVAPLMMRMILPLTWIACGLGAYFFSG